MSVMRGFIKRRARRASVQRARFITQDMVMPSGGVSPLTTS
jgi:hypothetical protein